MTCQIIACKIVIFRCKIVGISLLRIETFYNDIFSLTKETFFQEISSIHKFRNKPTLIYANGGGRGHKLKYFLSKNINALKQNVEPFSLKLNSTV